MNTIKMTEGIRTYERNVFSASMIIAMAALLTRTVYPKQLAAEKYALVAKTKHVSFRLRNETLVKMKVKVGNNEVTLDPGITVAVKCAIGDKLVVVDDTPGRPAGTVLTIAGAELSDNTLVFH